MGETPPNGQKFAESVKHILEREQQWNRWKNEGCPSLKVKHPETESASNEPVQRKGSIRKRKRKLGDQIQEATTNKKFLMGNANLTKLWNLCPDNFEAASAPERDFLPSMDEYLSEAVEQLDPANQVEEDYRKVHDGQWGWRALRLLAKKSPFFFTYGNNPIGTLPKYLTAMLKKHHPDWDSTKGGNVKDDSVNTSTPSAVQCTEENLAKIAANLEDQWQKLVPKLGQTSADIASYQKEETEEASKSFFFDLYTFEGVPFAKIFSLVFLERALLMLRKWAKDEGDGATKDELQYILEGLKMESALEGVF